MRQRAKYLSVIIGIAFVAVMFQNCGELDGIDSVSNVSSSSITSGPGTATLTWDANSEKDIEGYKVYYGNSANALNTIIDLKGPSTSPRYVVNNLSAGIYYFAVSAYNSAGESGKSSQAAFTVK